MILLFQFVMTPGSCICDALFPLFFLCLNEGALVLPFQCGCADDNNVADPAQQIRNFMEIQKSQQCGKQDLRIIEDRNILCRRVFIRCSNTKLPDCCRRAGADQPQKLVKRRHLEIHKHERNTRKT